MFLETWCNNFARNVGGNVPGKCQKETKILPGRSENEAKRDQDRANSGQEAPERQQKRFFGVFSRIQRAPRASKSAPRGPQEPPRAPKRAQESPKKVPRDSQEGPKRVPRAVQEENGDFSEIALPSAREHGF